MRRRLIGLAAAAALLLLGGCVPAPAALHAELQQLGTQASAAAAAHEGACPAPKGDLVREGICTALVDCLRRVQGAAATCQAALADAVSANGESYDWDARACIREAAAALSVCAPPATANQPGGKR